MKPMSDNTVTSEWLVESCGGNYFLSFHFLSDRRSDKKLSDKK